MSHEKNENERITLADIWQLCLRSKKKIAVTALICSLLAAFWALRMPILYQAEGSFKDSGKVRSGVSDAFNSLASMTNISTIDSPSIPLIKSRKVVDVVAKNMGLQAILVPEEKSWPLWRMLQNEIATIRDNLKAEWALWRKSKYPSLPDIHYPIVVNQVEYCGETPLLLNVLFTSETAYEVFENKRSLGKGVVGEPFFGPGYHFLLLRSDAAFQPVAQQRYHLILQPLFEVTQAVNGMLSVENDRNGKSILWMRFADRDRLRAANFVNILMESYRAYNVADDHKITQEQISYLNQRQSQIAEQLQYVMETHASRCSKELAGSGFPDVETEIAFFVANHQDYHSKLFSIELERTRLRKYLDEGFVYYDRYASDGDPSVINHLLEEMRELKQQSDTIELVLSRLPVANEEQLEQGLSLYLADLEQTRHSLRSIETLLASIQTGFLATSIVPENLLNHPRYLLAMWMKRLQEVQQRWLIAPPDEKVYCKEDWDHCKNSFISYLNNLRRLLQVYATNIEERVVRHQDYPIETQGLDLDAAWDLYNLYTKKLSELEAELLQGEFIAKHMLEPEFEVSSLSSVLDDKVSQDLFTKASKLVLELKDQTNRSEKEMGRLKEELSLQKQFLQVHLRQTLQLWRLNEKSLIEKIHSHQGLLRELIQMRLTVLEKHLEEFVISRLSNLEQEQAIIQQRQGALRDQMAHLPIKLIEQKLMDYQIEIDRMMIEQVMKLVESKNISGHLEVMQSAPLDPAVPPLHPRSCKLLFFIVLGALFGAIAGCGFLMLRILSRGFPATERLLRGAKQNVLGALPPSLEGLTAETLSPKQANLFRSSLLFLSAPSEKRMDKTILSVEKAAIGYGALLAALLAKRGEKVLHLCFNFTAETEELKDYLENRSDTAAVHRSSNGCYDEVKFGSENPFTFDLLLTPRFRAWLEGQQKNYGYIICSLGSAPSAPIALELGSLFYFRVIAIGDTPLSELENWFDSSGKASKTAFILPE